MNDEKQKIEIRTLCPKCTKRLSGGYPNNWCRSCYDKELKRRREAKASIPLDLGQKFKQAQQSGDWKALADSLAETIQGIASGDVKATAAQSAIIQHILNRAYGKVSHSQEEMKGAIGVVILPTLGDATDAKVCQKCKDYHLTHG